VTHSPIPLRPPRARRWRRVASALSLSVALSSIGTLSLLTMSATASAQTPPHVPANVTPPVVRSHVDAVYPSSAIAAGKHGDVVLTVTIDADGHVSKVDVAQSGGADLDEAATSAARQWTFEPALRDGKPVASRIHIPFHFAPPAPPPEIVETEKPNELPAQPATPHQHPVETPAPEPRAPEEVKVVGRRDPPSRGASDLTIDVRELARVPRANASDVLKLAPGILLTNEGGEGHAEQVFLRGFDAREGQDLEFTMGGVPINESGNLHGNGYADTHFIIPELIERVRVLEGPFDPRQGNYAVAGSADYQLGLLQRGLTAKYTIGSFGTQRMLLTWGPSASSAHTFAGAELYKTDGFGQNRDATRGTGMAQYEGALGSKGSYRVGATAYSTHFHSAGLLRNDDFRAGKVDFYDSYDLSSFARQEVPEGGDSSRFSVYGDLETRVEDTTLSQQIFVIKRNMRLLENFTGFLLDVQEPLQSVHLQRGDMLDLDVDELTAGARGAARLQGHALGQKQELELGYYARADQVSGSQQRLEANTGIPYKTETDLESQLTDIGLYGDANVRVTKWLDFRGGARADLFTFNVLDRCASHDVAHPSPSDPPIDESCLSQQAFGRPREPNQRSATSSIAVLPRGSVLLGPFAHLTFSASYGQGVRSIDPSYVTADVKTPFASIAAYEGGVTYAKDIDDTEIVARSIFFQTHVDRDLVFNETAGRNVLGNGTTRTGWVGAARVTGKFLDESANVTLVRSAYDDTHLLVAYVPDVVLRSDTALFADLPLAIRGKAIRGALGAGVTYVGPRALPFGQRSQDIFTVDASATLDWTRYELGIVATNLLDRRNRITELNYASDFHSQPQATLVPERHFTAGAPRGIFGTFAIRFGGP
jgi:TonB family protein